MENNTLKKILVVGALFLFVFLVLGVTNVEAAGNITSPEFNRTYPHSTHLFLHVDTFPLVTNCNFTLTWHGDDSAHGDYDYPQYIYGARNVPCANIAEGTYFNVDFDGRYTINVSGTVAGALESDVHDFYVDREEVDGTKVIAAMMLPFLILGIAAFVFTMGVKLDESEHKLLKFLFMFIPIPTFILSMYTANVIIFEYIKAPTISNMSNIFIYVLTIAVLIFFVLYWMLYLTRLLFRAMSSKYTGEKWDQA